MVHIPTKLQQFPNSSFQDIVRTDTRLTPPETTPARSMHTGKKTALYLPRRKLR